MSFNACIYFRYWTLVFINDLLAHISVILVHISVLLVSYWCTMSVLPGVSMRRTVMMLSMLPLKLCWTWSLHCDWSIIKGSGVAMAFIVLDSFAEFRSAAIFVEGVFAVHATSPIT